MDGGFDFSELGEELGMLEGSSIPFPRFEEGIVLELGTDVGDLEALGGKDFRRLGAAVIATPGETISSFDGADVTPNEGETVGPLLVSCGADTPRSFNGFFVVAVLGVFVGYGE